MFDIILRLFIIFVATYYGLTYDELLHGFRYPYLYQKIGQEWIYKNPNNKGIIKNIKYLFN